MIVADIKGKIVDNETRTFLKWFGMEDTVFSTDILKELFSKNPQETVFKFNIDTNGGFVDEAFHAYDIIRESGKINLTNAVENCHSSGIIILLAGAKENRSASKNAKFYIHPPEVAACESLNSDELREYADNLDACKKRILDLYVERTGQDYATLESLMNEERMFSSDEMLNYGFISKINSYNTNLKPNQMAEMTNEVKGFLGKAKELLLKITNLEKSDEQTPEKPTPEVIPEVAEPTEAEILKAENEALKAKIAETEGKIAESETKVTNLTTKVTEMTNLIEESKTVITNLEKSVVSTFKVPAKVAQPKATNKGGEMSAEDRKAKIKESLEKFNK